MSEFFAQLWFEREESSLNSSVDISKLFSSLMWPFTGWRLGARSFFFSSNKGKFPLTIM